MTLQSYLSPPGLSLSFSLFHNSVFFSMWVFFLSRPPQSVYLYCSVFISTFLPSFIRLPSVLHRHITVETTPQCSAQIHISPEHCSDAARRQQQRCVTTTHHFPEFLPSLPGGVGDVDASQVDALAAHDEQRGEAEQGDAAADHRQLGRLASSQLQLLDDVAAQDDAHAGAGHDDHT